MSSRRAAWLMCATLAAAGPALADELLRCRAIAGATERLACFDALAAKAAAAAAPAAPTAAAPEPAPARPAPPAAAPPPAPPSLPPESAFGLPARSTSAERSDIESVIPGAFDGWRPRDSFTLANGQVWQIADESEGAYSRRDPKVRIARGRLGGYFLFVEGIEQTPRVRRLK